VRIFRLEIFKKITAMVFVLCLILTQNPVAAVEAAGLDTQYFQDIGDLIQHNYNGQVTSDELTQGVLKGMFGSMDPYTTFFTLDEAKSFMNSIGGSYTGIGISMELSGGYILVLKVFAGSPAEKAGLIQGDKIAEVNGKSVIDTSIEVAQSLIMGEAGTKITLGIIRNGKSGIENIEITRGVIKVNPVTYEIRGGIGYIKIDSFNSNTISYLNNALEEIDKNNIKSIVLDLRNNPGGEVSQAVEVARKFVTEGVITTLDFKPQEYQDQVYKSSLKIQKYKLAVIVNEMSASASEILAGAIQDSKVGTLVGTKTFGKAKVQVLLPLLSPEAVNKYEALIGERVVNAYDLSDYGIEYSDSDLIGYTKITVGYYYTPSGKLIDLKGIDPDVAVENPKPVSDIAITDIVKLTKTIKPRLNSEGVDVLNAEKILKVLGYDVDSPDSLLDAKTFSAIKKFQKDSKLFPYGVLDFATQNALNGQLLNIILKYDEQYAKAVELLSK